MVDIIFNHYSLVAVGMVFFCWLALRLAVQWQDFNLAKIIVFVNIFYFTSFIYVNNSFIFHDPLSYQSRQHLRSQNLKGFLIATFSN